MQDMCLDICYREIGKAEKTMMPRKKTYDREKALDLAMHAFWSCGVRNLGVRELEGMTGINRFALQTEFGGKNGLLLETLERYLAMSRETTLVPLRGGGLDGIIRFFRNMTAEGAPGACGCLMVNTAIENVELKLDDVQKITDDHFRRMRELFEGALESARDNGELPADFDTASAAKSLLTFAMGTQVLSRMEGNASACRDQTDFIIAQIEGWRR